MMLLKMLRVTVAAEKKLDKKHDPFHCFWVRRDISQKTSNSNQKGIPNPLLTLELFFDFLF